MILLERLHDAGKMLAVLVRAHYTVCKSAVLHHHYPLHAHLIHLPDVTLIWLQNVHLSIFFPRKLRNNAFLIKPLIDKITNNYTDLYSNVYTYINEKMSIF